MKPETIYTTTLEERAFIIHACGLAGVEPASIGYERGVIVPNEPQAQVLSDSIKELASATNIQPETKFPELMAFVKKIAARRGKQWISIPPDHQLVFPRVVTV